MFHGGVMLHNNVILACAYKTIIISKKQENIIVYIRYFHIWWMKGPIQWAITSSPRGITSLRSTFCVVLQLQHICRTTTFSLINKTYDNICTPINPFQLILSYVESWIMIFIRSMKTIINDGDHTVIISLHNWCHKEQNIFEHDSYADHSGYIALSQQWLRQCFNALVPPGSKPLPGQNGELDVQT